jgi:YidC/Oxa1 family membrane protein insertase
MDSQNKNLVLALVLMLAVWLGFTLLFPPAPPSPDSSAVPTKEEPPAAAAPSSASTPAPSVAAVEIRERELVVDTQTYHAVFTNVGGRLKEFRLKQYAATSGADPSPVTLVEAGPARMATLRTTGSDAFAVAQEALYAVSVSEDRLSLAPGETRQVSFSATTAGGVVVEKVYTFRGDRYDFDLRLRLTNAGAAPARGIVVLSLVQPWDEEQKSSQFEFVGPATLVGDKLHTDDVDDLAKEPRAYGKETVWSAFTTKYFLTAAVPLAGAAEKVRVEKREGAVENILESASRQLAPGESAAFDYLLFFGPRDLDLLKVVDHELARVVDYGFFSPIAKPLLHVLKFFYRFVGNYGVAIILLTVIIKILFWPLTQKSYGSMKAMQKLQPEMQRLRDKYKSDRERMNREIMELYRTNRVNPLGGCLPMLVQIPVFFALYKVLMVSIELRHAPFALWITDLSAKDPYYVTPIIMGATMVIQQKMTPTSMDPVQAKMFMIMPVVFTFLFLNFPSGLVIYWLVNNLLTIVQQYLINRKA